MNRDASPGMDNDRHSGLRLPRLSEAPRAVVVDLDGTLLDPSGMLSARSATALEGALARGVPVVIGTARPARSVRVKVGPLFERVSVVQMSGVGLVHAGAVTRLASLAPEVAAPSSLSPGHSRRRPASSPRSRGTSSA